MVAQHHGGPISYHLVEFGSHRSSCRVCWSWTMWKQRITFFTRHATVVSCDDYGWWPLLINQNHFKFSRNGVAEVEIERFLFVTWLHMIAWTKVHVTLKFVTPNNKPPWIALWYGWPAKKVSPYFLPGPLSEIFTIANIQHTAKRISTCAEPEFRLSWIKLCSSDKHFTTVSFHPV